MEGDFEGDGTDDFLAVGKFQKQPRDISYFADVMIHHSVTVTQSDQISNLIHRIIKALVNVVLQEVFITRYV